MVSGEIHLTTLIEIKNKVKYKRAVFFKENCSFFKKSIEFVKNKKPI